MKKETLEKKGGKENDNFKYILCAEFKVFNEDNEFQDEREFRFVIEDLVHNNLLKERISALDYANSLITKFEVDSDDDKGFTFLEEEFIQINPNSNAMLEIRIYLENDKKSNLIFHYQPHNYTGIDSSIINGLSKEYKIFKNLNIDISQLEKTISIQDNDENKTKKIKMLDNGIDWDKIDVGETTPPIDLSILDDLDYSSAIADKKISQRTYSIKFKVDNDNNEIIVKSTKQLPKEIKIEIDKVIAQWQNLNKGLDPKSN